jgi:hypothetical protein
VTSAWADDCRSELSQNGFTVVKGVYPPAEVDAIHSAWSTAHSHAASEQVRTSNGALYAARNVLGWWPEAAQIWRRPPLPDFLESILGSDYGLVRVLFFDKPPERSWTLPWHKDLTIAVREHRQGSHAFTKPTTKTGLPHVEAPVELLESMATARLHLDDVTEENGPLLVLPGSHRTGKSMELSGHPTPIHACRGDVLLMRPLLAHASGRSHAGTTRHRRILHFEFAPSRSLADGFAWNAFLPGKV